MTRMRNLIAALLLGALALGTLAPTVTAAPAKAKAKSKNSQKRPLSRILQDLHRLEQDVKKLESSKKGGKKGKKKKVHHHKKKKATGGKKGSLGSDLSALKRAIDKVEKDLAGK